MSRRTVEPEQVRSLVNRGLHRGEIADLMGFDRTSIAKAAKANGIVLPYSPLANNVECTQWEGKLGRLIEWRAAGVALSKIAQRLGVSKNAVAGKLYRLGKCKPGGTSGESAFWREHSGELERLLAAGLSQRVIAVRIGTTKGAVCSRIATLRKRARRQPRPRIEFPPSDCCVFPLGSRYEPATMFCGERTARLPLPYCDKHLKIAYRPVRPEPALVRSAMS